MKTQYKGNSNLGGIYQIINLTNKKKYIGSCARFKQRYAQHKSALKNNRHHNKHLQASWNKHGADVFLFEVIEVIDDGKQIRHAREDELLKEVSETKNWCLYYNIKKQATVTKRKSYTNTPERTRQKKSLLMSQRWKLKPERKKLLAGMKKAAQTKERRERQSEIMVARWNNEEFRKKQEAELHKARKKAFKASVREQISSTLQQYYKENPHPNLGKPRTEKTKQKIRKSMKTSVPLLVVEKDSKQEKRFESLGHAAKELGFHISSVRRALQTGRLLGKRWLIKQRVGNDERRKQAEARKTD